VKDGGILGTSRAKMRRMTVALLFTDRTVTRAEIAALFAPGVLRTLSSPRGSMTYVVEELGFEKSDPIGQQRVSVVMVSTYAYPEGSLQTATLNAAGTIASLADVDCAPKFTITLAGSATGLIITTPGCTTTLTGSLVASDVVVVDSATCTVTVNNVNSISWFDRSGRFPRLTAGDNAVSVKDSANADIPAVVTWHPRVMGLI
jgi:hypothetical protein